MIRSSSSLLPWLLLLASAHAWCAQFVDVRDGNTAIVKISDRDHTRIKLERGRITEVFGDVFHKDHNASGRLVVVPDNEDGEVYVKPLEPSSAPIKVDLKTDRGKFSLLLQPVGMPGDALILRDRGPVTDSALPPMSPAGFGGPPAAQSVGAPLPKNTPHVRALKAMVLAMAGQSVPSDIEVRPLNEEVALWQEARLVLERLYLGQTMVGEHYTLTNVSAAPMVIDERELDRPGVLAVSVKSLTLRPGGQTPVWIVRTRAGE